MVQNVSQFPLVATTLGILLQTLSSPASQPAFLVGSSSPVSPLSVSRREKITPCCFVLQKLELSTALGNSDQQYFPIIQSSFAYSILLKSKTIVIPPLYRVKAVAADFWSPCSSHIYYQLKRSTST